MVLFSVSLFFRLFSTKKPLFYVWIVRTKTIPSRFEWIKKCNSSGFETGNLLNSRQRGYGPHKGCQSSALYRAWDTCVNKLHVSYDIHIVQEYWFSFIFFNSFLFLKSCASSEQ